MPNSELTLTLLVNAFEDELILIHDWKVVDGSLLSGIIKICFVKRMPYLQISGSHCEQQLAFERDEHAMVV